MTPSGAEKLMSRLGSAAQIDVPVVLKLLKSKGVACATVTYNYGDLIVDNGTLRLPGTWIMHEVLP